MAEAETEDEVATVVRAVPASGANVSLTASETVAPAALPDPEASAVQVGEEAMAATVVKKDISLSSCHRAITICHTSKRLAVQVAVVAEAGPVWQEWVDLREHPAAAEAPVISRTATDVMEQLARPVIQVVRDGTAWRETGGNGATGVRSQFLFFETSALGWTLQISSQLRTRRFAHQRRFRFPLHRPAQLYEELCFA